MKSMIIRVLAKPEVAKIDFSLVGIKISAASYKQVSQRIQSGKIKVTYTTRIKKNTAKYRYTHNAIFVRFRTIAGSVDREALLIHECTHAACDIAGKSILVRQSEAAAYVAQCLYFYYRNEAALSKPGAKPTFASSLLRESWKVATKARSNRNLSNTDIEPLMKAIKNHPTYRSRHSDNVAYDGV